MIFVTALFVGAAAYAQYQIPRHTAGRAKIALTRGILLLTGLLLGSVFAVSGPSDGLSALLAFLLGFGGAHVPAAIILLVKTARGTGKS